ncbi:conserved hypothetical protein [Mucor ambiguus]|uniref:Integrase zinc-binding domain-containing protein n=1 Tax=Mucor ambiguus TaxID=91626 RepID=A0A0C9MR03_9FUNG|nr:conserved hypothetical protein [Mucor ambiguus]
MSINLIQQQQDELRGLMPPLLQTSYDHHQHHSSISSDDYSYPMESSSMLPYSPSASNKRQSAETTHHYNDQDQYPSYEEFDAIVQDYLQNLSSKKRDKALIDQARYAMILQVLKDPRNTAVSTAQFRFWVKKMFQLTSRQIVCHDGKPVAMREQIYGILVRAHREAHHGGRDKTSALVRRRYSWIPKELIARFVRHCPFCISRRNGSQQSPLSLGIFLPATPPTYSMVSSVSMSAEDSRQRAPSMITSSSSASSNASYPEEIMMMAAATAHHQHQQQHQQQSISPFGAGTALDMSWQTSTASSQQQQQSFYVSEATAAAAVATSVSNTSSIFDNHHPHSQNGYYSNNNSRQAPYMVSYPPSSNSHSHHSMGAHESQQQQHQQPMTMQPALSVYYAQEYGLKHTPAYSLIDSTNTMTFVPPSSSSSSSPATASRSQTNALLYSHAIHASNTQGTGPIVGSSNCDGSPSLSPSSSSTSATSSPVHPAYHETTSDSKYIQRQQASSNSTTNTTANISAPHNALSLLSHHQSLF